MKAKTKLITALLTGALLAGAAACTDEAAGSSSSKHHAKGTVACHRVTAKAHVQGTGNYSLTLHGYKHNPVRVPKAAYKAAGVGDKYCTNK